MSLNEWADKLCSDLPDGWEVRIVCENGSGMVELYDRKGNLHEPDPFKTIEDQVEEMMAYAKQAEAEIGDLEEKE